MQALYNVAPMFLSAGTLAAIVALGCGVGALGALTGIGGGLILVPALVLYFAVPLPVAVGTSLACVIATSSGAAAVYVQNRLTNIRLAMVLELASCLGALTGAVAAGWLSHTLLEALLAAFLCVISVVLLRGATAPETEEDSEYQVRNLPAGLAGSYVAGAVSGLFGIGGGPIQVPLMAVFMGVPMKAAGATSNLMIGVTAATSAFLYYRRGHVLPALTAPLVLGVLAGSTAGAGLVHRIPSSAIKRLLAVLLAYLALTMLVGTFHVPLPWGRR